MGRKRAAVAALGAVAVVVGVATALAPALAGVVPVPAVPVSVVGGVAGLFALLVGLRRRTTTIQGVEPPVVEESTAFDTPGSSFDARLDAMDGIGVGAARHRREGREHLVDVAVAVLESTDGLDEAAAETALAAGTWTDDPLAAAYFADSPPRVGLRGALAGYLSRHPRRRRELAHAVAALQARLEGEGS